MSDEQRNVTTKMPVDREYDFEEYRQTDVPKYIQNEDELDRMLADIRMRKETGKLPRFLLGGPTGCGKTHCARYLASHLDVPLITIQGKYSLHEGDLLGSPALVNDQTMWNDGALTRALLASREEPVVLLLDEVNRVRPEAKGVLFSALDDRGRVELDGRGGEIIQGDPQNLIVIATVNEGSKYVTERLDRAERRRFGNKFSVTYLGLIDVEKEAQLVTDQTPVSLPLATEIVKTANDIRTQARDENRSAINAGVPTAMVLSWARTAFAYHDANLDDPAVEAARDAVLRPFYDENRAARNQALQIVKDRLSGIPVGRDAVEDWLADNRRIVKSNGSA
ncbi:AAA family ATPase [Haladaptatus sp. NG-SE-30]